MVLGAAIGAIAAWTSVWILVALILVAMVDVASRTSRTISREPWYALSASVLVFGLLQLIG